MANLTFQGQRIFFPGGGVLDFPTSTPTGVVIGTQIWQEKNVDDNIAGSRVYDDNESNRDIYGGLYNWSMIGDIETANPGWHVPTQTDWQTLATYLGGLSVAGGKMKEVGLTHWNTPNAGATNSSNFTGLPGGYYGTSYNTIGNNGYFWSSTGAINPSNAWGRMLYYNDTQLYEYEALPKTYFLSVRLIKD